MFKVELLEASIEIEFRLASFDITSGMNMNTKLGKLGISGSPFNYGNFNKIP